MRTTRRTLPTTVAKPEPVVTVDPVARVAQAVAAALVARVDSAGPEARGEPVGLAVREALAVVAALVDPVARAVQAAAVALEARAVPVVPVVPAVAEVPVDLAVLVDPVAREALAVVAALVELVEPVAPVAAEDPAALAVRAVPVALEGRRATARSSVAARSAMPTPSTAAAA